MRKGSFEFFAQRWLDEIIVLMQPGAIILCGGRSSRMGGDKASLPFGNETMLQRTVRIVGSAVDTSRIAIVAAPNQKLPIFVRGINVVRDREIFPGPLQALACGFAALPSDTEAVFVTGCDTPLLNVTIIEFLFAELGHYEAIVPEDVERLYPLSAVYNRTVSETISDTDQRSLHRWLEHLRANRISVEKLRCVDPELHSLRNLNTPEDYFAALAVAGLSTP